MPPSDKSKQRFENMLVPAFIISEYSPPIAQSSLQVNANYADQPPATTCQPYRAWCMRPVPRWGTVFALIFEASRISPPNPPTAGK